MDLLVIGCGIFLVVVVILELSVIGYRNLKVHERRAVNQRLKKMGETPELLQTGILRQETLSDVPWLNRTLIRIPGLLPLKRLITQADSDYSLGFFLLLSFMLICFSWAIGVGLMKNGPLAALASPFVGTLPILHLFRKRRRRILAFQEQLPEALDLVGRALKAGHAFGSGLSLAAEEFGAPLGKEFRQVVDEINFGIGTSDALKHLADRVDCQESRFFVVSVLLQRETGGNLTEILENLSGVLRERFKLQGKIRVLSAEGKLSGWFLVGLPVVLLLWLMVSAPDYAGILFKEPTGQLSLGLAGVFILLGHLAIKKIVTIKV